MRTSKQKDDRQEKLNSEYARGVKDTIGWIKKNTRRLCENGEPPTRLIDMWIVGNGDLSEIARDLLESYKHS